MAVRNGYSPFLYTCTCSDCRTVKMGWLPGARMGVSAARAQHQRTARLRARRPLRDPNLKHRGTLFGNGAHRMRAPSTFAQKTAPDGSCTPSTETHVSQRSASHVCASLPKSQPCHGHAWSLNRQRGGSGSV